MYNAIIVFHPFNYVLTFRFDSISKFLSQTKHMKADADQIKLHNKELYQGDCDHKLDKKVVVKRHDNDTEMALRNKKCNSDKFSMLKEHKEKTETNAMMKELEVKVKGLCLQFF